MPTRYPKEQMHRIKYTKLTPEQILGKLAAASSGPTSASPLAEVFAGKSLKIVLDNGPALSLSLHRQEPPVGGRGRRRRRAGRLWRADPRQHRAVHAHGAEDAARLHRRDRSGLQPGDGVRSLVQRLSGQPRSAASGLSRLRRAGGRRGADGTARASPTASKARASTGSRTTASRRIEYYPTVMYSNFVELTRFGGELSCCAPTDYIKISDDKYIYSRVEAEFSGTMTTYVLDPNRAEQVGMRLGFNETDTLEYYVFRGRGEWVGQIAQFEPFGDLGTTHPVAGQRRLRRLAGARASEGGAAGLPADEDQPDHDACGGGRRGRQDQDHLRTDERDGRQQGADQHLPHGQGADAALRQRPGLQLPVRRRAEAALAARRRRRHGVARGAVRVVGVGARRDHVRSPARRREGSRRVLDRDGLRQRAGHMPARHDGHAVHRQRGGGEDAVRRHRDGRSHATEVPAAYSSPTSSSAGR